MAASADDLRYYYSEHIGVTQQITAASGVATPLDTALEPGRYMLRVLAYGGASVWVRQSAFAAIRDAAAAAPSTQFLASTDAAVLNAPLITFMVHGGNSGNPTQDDGLSFFSVGGTATVQVTKISSRRA